MKANDTGFEKRAADRMVHFDAKSLVFVLQMNRMYGGVIFDLQLDQCFCCT